MKKFFYILLLMPVLAFAKTHLFVLFDAGETYALQPVIKDLIEEGETVHVLALGTAQTLMPHANTFSEIDRGWDRYRPLAPEQIDAVVKSYSPDVVTIGVASKIQLQVAETYQGKAQVVAYYDNFNPIDRSIYFSLIREIEPHVDLFLTASEFGARSSQAKDVRVVGNPNIDWMIAQMQEIKLPSYDKPVVTYIGGYDSDYGEALSLFQEGMVAYGDHHLLICPHPRSDGRLEKSFFPEAEFPESSLAAIAAADVVVCHRSTLGIKSLIAGKKVIFVDPVYSSMPEEWGAFLATDVISFQKAMASPPMEIKCQVPQESTILFRVLLADEKGK